MRYEDSIGHAFDKLFAAINMVGVELVRAHPFLKFFISPNFSLAFNPDMSLAPKGRAIEIYDPKPHSSYGPDIHKAIWSSDHNNFIGVDCDDIDPFDVCAQGWRELPRAD